MSGRHEIEKKWAREKYKVMIHSQKHYNLIREALKKNTATAELNNLIEQAFEVKPTKGSVENAYNHLWGYFKKICTEEERETSKQMKAGFMSDEVSRDELLQFISHLADKYEVEYLQNSSVLH